MNENNRNLILLITLNDFFFYSQRTRAEVLLERACLRKQGTCDVLESARLWSIPVWSLQKLLTWIKGLKESPLYHPPSKTSSSSYKRDNLNGKTFSSDNLSSSSKVQRLKSPFLKVEGFKRLEE